MKKGIHPNFNMDTVVTCACGNTWITSSTRKTINTDLCSSCHPFFTGEQRIVDTEGQVDRFYKKLQARKDYIDTKKAMQASRVSPERPVIDLELGKRATEALSKAGIENVGQILGKLAISEASLLDIDGFGRKSLSDLKKRLRQIGYALPEGAKEIKV